LESSSAQQAWVSLALRQAFDSIRLARARKRCWLAWLLACVS
jgi:hypothetical protein